MSCYKVHILQLWQLSQVSISVQVLNTMAQHIPMQTRILTQVRKTFG